MSKRAQTLLRKGKEEAAKRSPAKALSTKSSSVTSFSRQNIQNFQSPQVPDSGGNNGRNTNVEVPTPPCLIVSSAEKVQDWLDKQLVSQSKGESDKTHKRKLFTGLGEKDASPNKNKRVSTSKGEINDLATGDMRASTAIQNVEKHQKETSEQQSCSAKPAANGCARDKPFKRPPKKINSSAVAGNTEREKIKQAPVKNSHVKISKKLFSPAKSGKPKTSKKGAAVGGGMGTDWRKLVPNGNSQRAENVSIIMEYNNDDMRPPEFYIEQDNEDSNDGVVPLDLSPQKRVAISNSPVTSPRSGTNAIMDESTSRHHDSDTQEQEINPDDPNVLENQEVINNDVTTPPTHKRKMLPKDSKRKRSINQSKWQRNVSSKAFNNGTEYTTSTGKQRRARTMGEPCTDKCNRCSRRLSHAEREKIFKKFWKLENLNRKRDFITRHIKMRAPDTVSTSPECTRQSSRRYFFTISGEELLVCKTMFLHTLGIVDCWIETALKKCKNGFGLSPDKRGRHANRPQTPENATIQSVKTHINLFPRVPSHYTRERSQREYLETEVKSVERMFRLYTEWAKENAIVKPASASLYRRIFNTEFNLGFFLPKKDQCETCNKWKHAGNQEERRELVETYGTHLKNKKEIKELKVKDVKSSSDTRCIACFDLQKVLICPRAETSLFFYKNKMSLYNFTVFDTRLKEGHCFLWTETDGHKGPNEIGTSLLHFIEKKVDEGIEEFSFYSDAPTSQNRNRMIFSMYLVASARYKVNICHRFLESGHSYSEADSMHARIEAEAKRVQEIFTPDQWTDLIKNAKQDGKPYIVSQLKNEEILDLHYLVDRQNWNGGGKNKVYWSKVREVSVKSDTPNTIFYRYNFHDELAPVTIRMQAGQMPDMNHFQYPSAYTGKFPLPENKKSDIRELLMKDAIPREHHACFERYLLIGEHTEDDDV